MRGYFRRFFLGALAAAFSSPLAAADICAPRDFEGARFIVCVVSRADGDLRLFATDGEGKPFGSFSRLVEALGAKGLALRFGMNAGMYDHNNLPVGYYVEDGRQTRKLVRNGGEGNFYLKPNGVFFLKGGRPQVMETDAFARARIAPDFATQSGPMLVIDGRIHPKFNEASENLKRRNGVGVAGEQTIFAIADLPVSFHHMAQLFRDGYGVKNALFLDGSISSLHHGQRSDWLFPLGPIVGLVGKK